MDDAKSARFGMLLQQFRRQARLSQDGLASRAGLAVRTVRNLEKGRTQPRLDSVQLLARGLRLAGPSLALFEAAAGLPAVEAAGPVRQLPRDLPDFGERDAGVAAVEASLAGSPAAVGVVAVTGPAGVGKTALAVHVAHRLREQFPDGQLYVRLRAGDAGPLAPGEVLGRFLRALGLDGSAVPPGLDERASLFRSRLADRRVLVLLDDATGEAQVRPLLPGGPGNAVLVTCRRPPAGLEGVRTVRLDVLEPAAAVRMLGRIAGPDRVAAAPAAAARIAAACGGLPLALRIAAARIATAPGDGLDELAGALTDERRRLDELAVGDLAVRAGFEIGYRDLDPPARRVFRLLGLLPTTDLPAWTVEALLGVGPRPAREVTARLVRTGLLDQHGSGPQARYGMHDLLRLYARERAEAEEPTGSARAALRRVLSGWLALADEADRRLPSDVLPLADRVPAGWRPDPATVAVLLERPLEWFEQERAALLAAVGLAAERVPDLAPGLADSLVDFCATRDYPDDWATVSAALVRVAGAAGDRRLAGHAERRLAELALYRSDEAAAGHAEQALAHALRQGTVRDLAAARLTLGAALRVTGRPADSLPHLRAAQAGFAEAGDRNGEGHAHNEYGMAVSALGDTAEARRHLAAAAGLLRAGGDLRGEARTLVSLGGAALRAGDPATAVEHYRRSQQLARRLADRTLLVTTAVLIGRAQVQLGEIEAATAILTRALADAREQHRPDTVAVASLGLGEARLQAGDLAAARERFAEARSMFATAGMAAFQGLAETGLGDVALAEGDVAAARASWQAALAVLDAAAPAQVEPVRARLAGVPTP